ncbi:ABC transporter ATP-binding protein [Corynebacterium nuruki]|uniref:ABC transporter ATP-binding protein n=1 Tax=Corynebacterium nuruki TaxID=1032851 RepID=UPI0002485BEB|nr:ABC transporter ATP-binding protein [Corynebacterium nuruki]
MTGRLTVSGLSVSYDHHEVVHDVDFTVPPGQVTALIGPNGTGKSTLLGAVAGLLESTGRVDLDGSDLLSQRIDERARCMAMVPQTTTLSISFPAREVITMGRHPHRGRFTRETPEDRRIIEETLDITGVRPFADHPVDQLSGGQRQLVHLARAFAQSTPVLLLDEPTSALDLQHQVAVYQLLRDRAAAGATVLVVLHDLNDVGRWCDRAVLLHQGRVHAEGTTDEVLTEDLLSEVYDIPVGVEHSGSPGRPRRLTVVPLPDHPGAGAHQPDFQETQQGEHP